MTITGTAPSHTVGHDPRPALDALARGELIVGVDDISGTCDLLLSATRANTFTIAEMIARGSGFVCVCIDSATARRLRLPPMTWESAPGRFAGQMGVSVDAVDGTTTGISAHDRARTIRALCAQDSGPQSFTRPGHVIPVLVPDLPTGTERTSRIARAGRLARSLTHPAAPESCGADGPPAVAFSSLVSLRDECEIACADEATDFGLPVLHYAALTSRTSPHVPAQPFSHHQESLFDDHHSSGSSRRVS